jgi:hypothetical protein
MAKMIELKLALENNEKTWVLAMRNRDEGKLNTNQIAKKLEPINWKRVCNVTRVYTKIIKDDEFTEELNKLKIKLAEFKGDSTNADVEFLLSVYINLNEVGDAVEGLKLLKPQQ